MSESAQIIMFGPSDLSAEAIEGMMEGAEAEEYEIGMAYGPICAFNPGSSLRAAAGDWWRAEESYHPRERQTLRDKITALGHRLSCGWARWRNLPMPLVVYEPPDCRRRQSLGFHNFMPRSLRDLYGNGENQPRRVRLQIFIEYPLQRPWAAIIELDHDRLGEIFGVAHDLYKQVYDLDDASWHGSGQENAPRIPNDPDGPAMLNRAEGQHVWGHDMIDLCFEGVSFVPCPDVEESEPIMIGSVAFSIGS